MKISVNKRDMLWGYASTIFSMCINLMILPLVLVLLDNESIGMYYVFTSLSALVSFFDFGFGPAFSRSFSYAWSGVDTLQSEGGVASVNGEPNYVLLKKVISACKVFYLCISVFALLCCLTIGTVYIQRISGETKNNAFFLAWLIYALAIFFNLLFGYYPSLLRGVGGVTYANISMVISRLVQIFLCVLLLNFGLELVGIAIAYLLYSFCYMFLDKFFFNRVPNVREQLKNCEYAHNYKEIIGLVRIMFPNTWKEGVVTLSNYVANQGTTIICSLFFSLYDTGLYSISTQLAQAVSTISFSLCTTSQPAMQSAYANRDMVQLKKHLSTAVFSFTCVYIVGMLCVVTIGKPFIALFKPDFEMNVWLMIGVGIYQFVLKFRNCYAIYFSSTNRVIYYKAYFASATLGILLTLIVLNIQNIGLIGLVVSQIFAQLVYNVWYWPNLAHRELKLKITELFMIGAAGFKEMFVRSKKVKR